MMFFPFRKRSNVSASADGICKLIGEDAPQLDTLALNVGFNDVDASKLEIDREFWEECMGVIRESFQSALPNLKFKILSSYRSDPWNWEVLNKDGMTTYGHATCKIVFLICIGEKICTKMRNSKNSPRIS